MTTGDTVQIRQKDGGVDYWIYATVINPATGQVQVNHPGNAEHGKTKIVAGQDIRTKSDVQALLTTAQSLASGAQLTAAQIATLSAADGFFKKFQKGDESQVQAARTKLHQVIVSHYQTQVNALT